MNLYRSSAWTGRAPRSMASAFGPYTDRRLLGLPAPIPRADRIAGVILACLIGIAGAVALVVWWTT